jgi:23S rRNA pseudouridine2605 synthase
LIARVYTMIPTGRLDYMTSGLMLLTNDGELAYGLERSNLPRTYLVKAYGGLHRQKLTSLQRHGRLRCAETASFFEFSLCLSRACLGK